MISAIKNMPSKRGLCYGSSDTPPSPAELALLASRGITWFYNWHHSPPAALAPWTSGTDGMHFVPMLFSLRSDTTAVAAHLAALPEGSTQYILVLNEPNHKHQAWATPQEAAAHWVTWEKLAGGFAGDLRLVGPQLTYGSEMPEYNSPERWMAAFLDAYRATHGREPRIHAIGFHFYGRQGLSKQLIKLNAEFGKPIWLTEFAYWKAATLDEQKAWMKKYVNMCESSACVERYCWFIGRSAARPLLSLLGEGCSVTELGDYYASLPVCTEEAPAGGGDVQVKCTSANAQDQVTPVNTQ